jgi:hypothetical protein
MHMCDYCVSGTCALMGSVEGAVEEYAVGWSWVGRCTAC